jgi:hypothetical protein
LEDIRRLAKRRTLVRWLKKPTFSRAEAAPGDGRAQGLGQHAVNKIPPFGHGPGPIENRLAECNQTHAGIAKCPLDGCKFTEKQVIRREMRRRQLARGELIQTAGGHVPAASLR